MRAEWKAAEKYEVPLCFCCLSQLGGRQKKGNGTLLSFPCMRFLESIYSFVLGGECHVKVQCMRIIWTLGKFKSIYDISE